MEKVLVLQILDQSWMEHLRTMDHLRSSVGLRGYAQVDPKVEYKREGMKIFEEMWSGVSDRVTDLVFRMEQLDPDFLSYLGARWQLDRAQAIGGKLADVAESRLDVGRLRLLDERRHRRRQRDAGLQQRRELARVGRDLLLAARPALEDLRLIDGSGQEVAFLIEQPVPQHAAQRRPQSFRTALEAA